MGKTRVTAATEEERHMSPSGLGAARVIDLGQTIASFLSDGPDCLLSVLGETYGLQGRLDKSCRSGEVDRARRHTADLDRRADDRPVGDSKHRVDVRSRDA